MTSRAGDTLPVAEISILWLTAGLSCDGDTIAMTAATQPSLEDLAPRRASLDSRGSSSTIRSSPTESGRRVRPATSIAARAASSDPFILVVEGSIPDETNKAEGYWATFGTDPAHRPADHHLRLDRSARAQAWAVVAAGTCAAYGGIHAMAGNPTGCMGLPDYLGWEWRSAAGIPIVCLPGCPVQPDNMTETLLYLLHQAVGPRAADPARRGAPPALAVRADGARGLRPRRLLRAGRSSPTRTARTSAS